jgi:hypothetical protein
MSDVYPPHKHFDEDRFDRYVAQGMIHKEVVIKNYGDSATNSPYAVAGG